MNFNLVPLVANAPIRVYTIIITMICNVQTIYIVSLLDYRYYLDQHKYRIQALTEETLSAVLQEINENTRMIKIFKI